MDSLALGSYARQELSGPVRDARRSDVVIFSGAKLNKLVDLMSIVQRQKLRLIVTGGLLALPLLFARGKLTGRQFDVGMDYSVVCQWFPLAEELLVACERRGIDLLTPHDFVLDDQRIVAEIPTDRAQRDIGPSSIAAYRAKLLDHIARNPTSVVFYNGAVGQFEREEFSHGTRALIATLMHLHSLGVPVYVGGGEGQTALMRWGQSAGVTHCFTAGTTILKSLGARPIPYLWALANAARRQNSAEKQIAI